MALNPNAFSQGLMQGFNFVDTIYERRAQRRFREEALNLQEQRLAAQRKQQGFENELATSRDQRATEQLEANLDAQQFNRDRLLEADEDLAALSRVEQGIETPDDLARLQASSNPNVIDYFRRRAAEEQQYADIRTLRDIVNPAPAAAPAAAAPPPGVLAPPEAVAAAGPGANAGNAGQINRAGAAPQPGVVSPQEALAVGRALEGTDIRAAIDENAQALLQAEGPRDRQRLERERGALLSEERRAAMEYDPAEVAGIRSSGLPMGNAELTDRAVAATSAAPKLNAPLAPSEERAAIAQVRRIRPDQRRLSNSQLKAVARLQAAGYLGAAEARSLLMTGEMPKVLDEVLKTTDKMVVTRAPTGEISILRLPLNDGSTRNVLGDDGSRHAADMFKRQYGDDYHGRPLNTFLGLVSGNEDELRARGYNLDNRNDVTALANRYFGMLQTASDFNSDWYRTWFNPFADDAEEAGLLDFWAPKLDQEAANRGIELTPARQREPNIRVAREELARVGVDTSDMSDEQVAQIVEEELRRQER